MWKYVCEKIVLMLMKFSDFISNHNDSRIKDIKKRYKK